MNARIWRIIAAIIAGFMIGAAVSFYNGHEFLSALSAGLWFSLILGALVSILTWAVDTAVRKGYSALTGFLLVLVLNILGILILLWLPAKASEAVRSGQRPADSGSRNAR